MNVALEKFVGSGKLKLVVPLRSTVVARAKSCEAVERGASSINRLTLEPGKSEAFIGATGLRISRSVSLALVFLSSERVVMVAERTNARLQSAARSARLGGKSGLRIVSVMMPGE
jgi:hypothetical protein